MALNAGEVQIKLLGDKSDFDNKSNQVIQQFHQMRSKFDSMNRGIEGKAGAAGSKAGKAFVEKYAKEFTFLAGALRFAGLGKLAEMLDLSRTFGESSIAKGMGGEIAGTATGHGLARQVREGFASRASSELVGNAVGEAVGNYFGRKHIVNAIEKGFANGNGVKKIATEAIPKGMESLFRQSQFQYSKIGFGKMRYPRPGALGVPASTLALSRGLPSAPTIGMGGAAALYAGSLGGTVLAGAAGAGLALAGTGIIAKLRQGAREKEIEGFKNLRLVEEIEAITDPMERLSVILEKLGKDGPSKFMELAEGVKDFKKELADNKEWRIFSETAKQTWDATYQGFLAPLGRGLREGVSWLVNVFQSGTLGEDLVNNLVESEASLQRMQERYNEWAQAKKAEDDLQKSEEKQRGSERVKLQEKLKQLEFDALETSEDKLEQLEDELAMAQSLYDQYSELEGFDNEALRTKIQMLELEKRISDEKEQQTRESERQKQVDEQIIEATRNMLDAKDSYNQTFSDRYKLSVRDMANATPWTLTGLAQKQQAQSILKAEYLAMRNEFEGYTGAAKYWQSVADTLRGNLFGLKENERYPMKNSMQNVERATTRLAQLAENEGVRTIVVMG